VRARVGLQGCKRSGGTPCNDEPRCVFLLPDRWDHASICPKRTPLPLARGLDQQEILRGAWCCPQSHRFGRRPSPGSPGLALEGRSKALVQFIQIERDGLRVLPTASFSSASHFASPPRSAIVAPLVVYVPRPGQQTENEAPRCPLPRHPGPGQRSGEARLRGQQLHPRRHGHPPGRCHHRGAPCRLLQLREDGRHPRGFVC